MNIVALTLARFNALFPDEEAARAWFERARWPDGPVCQHCDSINKSWWLKTRRLWCCGLCRRQFSVTAGTPMPGSHLSLLTWARAIYLILASSKGLSAVKLGEMLGVCYSTAWFLGHRIRAMMSEADPLLSGVVELDEMYGGAPPRRKAAGDLSPPHKSGRGPRRPLVLVAAQRGGTVVAKTIPTHSRAAIRDALNGLLSPDATVMTDGLPAYKQFGRDRQHLAVTHSAREYARTDAATGRRVHVNRVESFNSLLRRAIIGVWHWISAKHLQRYAGETTFRSNHGDEACLDRMARLIRNGDGNRLSYAELVEAA